MSSRVLVESHPCFVLRWKMQGLNTNSSVIPDDDVLLLKQFGH